MPVPIEKWQWFGTAGHFICSKWCRFHITTKVGRYLISTVGEYVHPSHSAGSEQAEAKWLADNWPGEDIGCDRKYETMVFIAGKACMEHRCGRCGLPSLRTANEIEGAGYNTAGDATRGHMKLCRKYANK